MTVKEHQSLWPAAVLALLGTALILSCNGDGVGLDEDGDALLPIDTLPTEGLVVTIVSARDNTLYETLSGNGDRIRLMSTK